MASLCRTCGDKAEITTSLLDTSRHHLQWAMNNLNIELDGVLPTSVCVPCNEIIRQWTLFLSKLEKANSLFSTMTANNQSLLHQLTSDSSNTSVPSKPSTSLCSTRLSHQVLNNVLPNDMYSIKSDAECISINHTSSFATPIEAIYISDMKCELDLDKCEISIEDPLINHDAGKQSTKQVQKPSNTTLSSLPGTEKVHYPQVPCQHISRSHTSQSCESSKPPDHSTASAPELSLPQHPVTEYLIEELTVRASKLSDQVVDPQQQNHAVSSNVVDNQTSEHCNLDDQYIEVPFEAIHTPELKCEPDLFKTEPSSDLSEDQSKNKQIADNKTVTVKQETIRNAGADSDDQPDLPELETSPEVSNKDDNTCASVFSCALCNFTTNGKSKITSHIKQHVKLSRYQCQECSKSFKYKRGLHRHISRVHSNKCSFKCALCERGFHLENRYKAHIKDHDKILQCDVCGKILSSKQSLTEHKMTIHTKSSPLPCDMCSKIFYIEASLKRHSRQVHSNLSFKCDICDKYFKSKLHLRGHQRQVHAPVCAISCNQCEKSFASNRLLKQHSVVHSDSRPFQCEKCGSCFIRNGDLTYHIGTVHSNVRAYVCHVCGKSFIRKCEFTQHLFSHSDVRNYKCEQCGKQFKAKVYLTKHLSSHSEIRPFACAQCHKKFKCKADLVQHLHKAHCDLRPFSCDKCSFACKSKYNLKLHQFVHSNVRNFECQHCKSKYKYRSDLSVHVKTKHSNLL